MLQIPNTKRFAPWASFLPRWIFVFNRTFVDARIKWVRDPYLDAVVEREKNLPQCLSLKNLLLSSPCMSLPLSVASTHKSHLNLPTTALNFFLKYPSLFHVFRPCSSPSHLHVKLTPEVHTLHQQEHEIHNSMTSRESAAQRLAKLLMLTRACKIPISIIDDLKFDLGLPNNYALELVSYFPEYFRICTFTYEGSGDGVRRLDNVAIGLELVSWRKELAVPMIMKDFGDDWESKRRGRVIKFPLSFAPGFDLQKKVKDWVDEWQCLPYISPYEDAFHLAPTSDQAEKWTVGVLHEILSLMVSKKTEVKNVLRLGEYLGFGSRFKKALAHHPGIFYVSNKIKTQTVVLREAFRKDFLIDKHPLMGMRHRYMHLMNKLRKRKKIFDASRIRNGLKSTRDANGMKGRKRMMDAANILGEEKDGHR